MGKGNTRSYCKRVYTQRWVYNIGDPVLIFLMDWKFGCCGIDIVMPKQKFIGGHNSWSRFCLEREVRKGRKADKVRREIEVGVSDWLRGCDGPDESWDWERWGCIEESDLHEGVTFTNSKGQTIGHRRQMMATRVRSKVEREFEPDLPREYRQSTLKTYHEMYKGVFRELSEMMNTGRIAMT